MAEKKDSKVDSIIRKSTFILITILISSLFLTFTSLYFFFEALLLEDVEFLFKYAKIHFFSAELRLNVFPIVASTFILILYIINLFGLDRLFANVLKIKKHIEKLDKDIFLKRAYRFFYATDAYKLFIFITFVLIPLISIATIMYKFLALHDLKVLIITSLILIIASIASFIFLIRRYEEFDFHELADHFIGLIFILFLTIVFIYLYFIFLSFINASKQTIFKWITFVIVPLPMIIYIILAIKVFPKNKKVLDVTQLFIPVIFLIMAIVVFIVNIVFIYMKDIPKKYKYAYALIPKIEVKGKDFLKLYLMGFEHYLEENAYNLEQLEIEFVNEFRKNSDALTVDNLQKKLIFNIDENEDNETNEENTNNKENKNNKENQNNKFPQNNELEAIEGKFKTENGQSKRNGSKNTQNKQKVKQKISPLKFQDMNERFEKIYKEAIKKTTLHIQKKKEKFENFPIPKETKKVKPSTNKGKTQLGEDIQSNEAIEFKINEELLRKVEIYIHSNLQKIAKKMVEEYYEDFMDDFHINRGRWLSFVLRPTTNYIESLLDLLKEAIEDDKDVFQPYEKQKEEEKNKTGQIKKEEKPRKKDILIQYKTGAELDKNIREFYRRALIDLPLSKKSNDIFLAEKKFMVIELVSDEVKQKYIYILLLEELLDKKFLLTNMERLLRSLLRGKKKREIIEFEITKLKIILDTLDFKRRNLRYIHLLNVYSELANFENADLKGANVPLSILSYSNFKNADLRYSEFIASWFFYSLFIETLLKETDLSKSYFSHTLFRKVNFEKTNLSEAVIEKSIFIKPKFNHTNLTHTRIIASIFIEPNFEYLDLTETYIPKDSLFLVSNPKKYKNVKGIKFNNLKEWYQKYGKKILFKYDKKGRIVDINDKIFFVYFIYTLNYIRSHPILARQKDQSYKGYKSTALGPEARSILKNIKNTLEQLNLHETEKDIMMVIKEEKIPIGLIDDETYKAILILLTIILMPISICYFCRNKA